MQLLKSVIALLALSAVTLSADSELGGFRRANVSFEQQTTGPVQRPMGPVSSVGGGGGGGATGTCTAGQFVSAITSSVTCGTPAGGGDVVGPGAATDGAVVLFDGTSGGLIKDSFFILTGPSATRTFTFPNANATMLYSGGALGTPASGTATNLTGLPIAGITGLGTGIATALAANLNGSGAISATTSPTFVTPVLGVAAATSVTASSFLKGSGAFFGYTTTTGSVTLDATNSTIECLTNACTVNLPTAVGIAGRVYTVKNLQLDDAATVEPAGSETIDGDANTAVTGGSISFQSDNANWRIIGSLGLTISGFGSSGECLTSNGAGALPTWQTCGSGGGAPSDATYITQTANGSLSNEQAIGGLSSGIMRVATTTGVITALTDSAGIAANVSDETGSGVMVFATSPALTTPNIGTPSAGTLTNTTGFPTANLAGAGAGVLTFLATPSSANLATAVTNETGSGALVFATSPALVTPDLGTPSAVVLTNATGAVGASLSSFLHFTPAVCQNATASLGGSTPTTLGAAATCVGTTAASGDPAYGTATFAAGGANTEFHGHFNLEADWTGAIDLTLIWNSLSNASGDVVWEVQFGCTATGEVPTSISFNNTAFTAVANQTSPTAAFNVATKTSITTTGCAAGETAFFIIHRDTDTSGDTLDQAVELIEAKFKIRRAVVIGG